MPIPDTQHEGPKTFTERGYTWPMSISQRDRLLLSMSPDMRAVFYDVEMRAREALGAELFSKKGRR